MIRRILLVSSLVIFSGAAVGAANGVFILPPDQGAALLKQCSRPTPDGATAFWTPSRGDIAELERRLVPFLKSTKSGSAVLPLSRFHRQYIGFVKDGKRYIYGSFYIPWPDTENEASRPVIVCDGGKSFWGIVYSVKAQSFSALRFNGPA